MTPPLFWRFSGKSWPKLAFLKQKKTQRNFLDRKWPPPPFGNFPEIHRYWKRRASLISPNISQNIVLIWKLSNNSKYRKIYRIFHKKIYQITWFETIVLGSETGWSRQLWVPGHFMLIWRQLYNDDDDDYNDDYDDDANDYDDDANDYDDDGDDRFLPSRKLQRQSSWLSWNRRCFHWSQFGKKFPNNTVIFLRAYVITIITMESTIITRVVGANLGRPWHPRQWGELSQVIKVIHNANDNNLGGKGLSGEMTVLCCSDLGKLLWRFVVGDCWISKSGLDWPIICRSPILVHGYV